jgi:hypothetical protein
MADKLIAETPEGDKLYQVGATTDSSVIGIPPVPQSPIGLVQEPTVFAYGYVQYADGTTYKVDYIQSFLGRGIFEQVAELDLTVTEA